MTPIDAVITWVDGDDPVHRAKRRQYGSKDFFQSEDVAAATRFSSLGEIFWCVASLNRFAPFLRKIYIVTDAQDPHLEDFLEKTFPEGYIPIEIVDHRTIFRGYEQYLPTFNSISLETMTWRIPGLSEHYIEFNDDLMLCAPVKPSDFFTEDGGSICYATKFSLLWAWITRKIKPKRNGRTKVTFKGSQMNAAFLAKQKFFFFKLNHTPKALNRVFFEEYFREHPQDMLRNIQYRFRSAEQFTSQELQYLLLYRQGRCKVLPVKGNLFFLQPKRKPNYVAHKLEKLRKSTTCKFCCFNSIDLASDADRRSILSWIEQRLHISVSN